MTSINECIFSEEIKEEIYNLYKGSNLEVLEYVHSILPNNKHIEKELHKYTKLDQFDDCNECLDIFWNIMDYINMSDYIAKREKEI